MPEMVWLIILALCLLIEIATLGLVTIWFAGGALVTFFVAMATDSAVKAGAHAGNIVREVAKIAGGNGGGKPDSAMAGGKETDKAQPALDAVPEIVKALLK